MITASRHRGSRTSGAGSVLADADGRTALGVASAVHDDAVVAPVEAADQSHLFLIPATAEDTRRTLPRATSGALWSGASTLMLKLANIVLMAVVVRVVSPREFGIFAVAVTVHAIVASMSELGVISVLQRGDTDPDKLAPTVGTVSLVSAAAMASGMFFLAPWLARELGAPEATAALRVMALAVLMVGVFAVPGAMLAREFRQDRIFLANLIAFGPSSALLLGLATLGDGALAFAWSRVLGQLIAGSVMTYLVAKRYGYGLAKGPLTFVLGVGLPLAMANLVGYTLLNADYAFIGRLLGPVELGTYMLAFNIAGWSTSLFSSMVNGVAVPLFSRLRHDRAELNRVLLRAHRALALVSWPIGALTLASAYPLIDTIYGHKWIAAAPVLAVLAPYGVLAIHALLYSNVLVGGAGHARMLLYVQLVWLICLVPMMVAGIHLWGTVGAAAAHVVVVVCVVMPCYLIAARRMSGVRAAGIVTAVAPVACAAAVAAAADSLVSAQFHLAVVKLLAGLAVGGVVYLVCVAHVARPLLPSLEGGRFMRVATVLRGVLDIADRPRVSLARTVGRLAVRS
jgi:lipopolysaccharide exporter